MVSIFLAQCTLIVCIKGQRKRSISSKGGEYGVTCRGRSISACGGVMVTKVRVSNFNKFHPVVGHFFLVVAVRR
jgi:hypothetical protein